jgi:hypothetical protein
LAVEEEVAVKGRYLATKGKMVVVPYMGLVVVLAEKALLAFMAVV